MPAVYDVSGITNILSGAIQKNVLVRGEVEKLADNAFFLSHEGKKLRCFIPGGNIAQFGSLLTSGKTVVVDGKITLFSFFSQYQITVKDISVHKINTNACSVTEITNKISHLITGRPELQNIQMQGKVLAVFEAKVSNWNLCDMNGSPALQIKCVRPGPIRVPVKVGNDVCIRGKVSIYPPRSLYQIDVSDVKAVIAGGPPACQCPGCASCTIQACSPLQDPDYELCTNCYHESPDREDRVAQAVYAYFDALGGNGFSPKKEQEIQIGAVNTRADVVLVKDGTETFAAIAECKGAGYVGNGKAQLNGYLSASDTGFGIFANRADPVHWEFYEKQGQNQYELITCDQFKEEVRGLTERERIRTSFWRWIGSWINR